MEVITDRLKIKQQMNRRLVDELNGLISTNDKFYNRIRNLDYYGVQGQKIKTLLDFVNNIDSELNRILDEITLRSSKEPSEV